MLSSTPGSSSKKNCTGTPENLGAEIEAAGADAVRALFVFLDLLERDSQEFPQLLLAHANELSAHADSASYMHVDEVRIASCHFSSDLMPPGLTPDAEAKPTVIAVAATSELVLV
jgi:hypothetical protein